MIDSWKWVKMGVLENEDDLRIEIRNLTKMKLFVVVSPSSFGPYLARFTTDSNALSEEDKELAFGLVRLKYRSQTTKE